MVAKTLGRSIPNIWNNNWYIFNFKRFGFNMNWNKFLIFVISVMSISIVVFNNITDIWSKMFEPQFNMIVFIGFGLATLVNITYLLINKNMLK